MGKWSDVDIEMHNGHSFACARNMVVNGAPCVCSQGDEVPPDPKPTLENSWHDPDFEIEGPLAPPPLTLFMVERTVYEHVFVRAVSEDMAERLAEEAPADAWQYSAEGFSWDIVEVDPNDYPDVDAYDYSLLGELPHKEEA
jgi:hypothetical protein